jgi:hypothetical protein
MHTRAWRTILIHTFECGEAEFQARRLLRLARLSNSHERKTEDEKSKLTSDSAPKGISTITWNAIT